MGKPRADRKMNDFRIFYELLAKTMLKAIDFTDVLEVYRRKEKPEILGITTFKQTTLSFSPVVEKKSPRYWALQHYDYFVVVSVKVGRKEKPEVV